MNRLAAIMAVAAAMITLGVVANSDAAPVEVLHREKRSEVWNEFLSKAPFLLLRDSVGVMHSAEEYSEDAELHLVFKGSEPGRLDLQVFRDGKRLLSVPAHLRTSFAAGGGRLFVAHYEPDESGCEVAAYDLDTGAEAWRTELHGEHPAGASGYRNEVVLTINLQPLPEKGAADGWRHSVVLIKASEGFCDYYEVLDATTGESIAIRNFRVGF